MNLRTLFAIPTVLILLATLCLAGMTARQELAGYDRGAGAIMAVERMRLMVLLQTGLWAERVASNAAIGGPYPTPDSAARRLAETRHDSDLAAAALVADLGAHRERESSIPFEPFLAGFEDQLVTSRAAVDVLLSRDGAQRPWSSVKAVMPGMLAASAFLEQPLAQASVAVSTTDRDLSGLLAVARLASLLKDGVNRITAVLLLRFTTGQALNGADVEEVHVLLAQTAQLTWLIRNTIDTAEPTDALRMALVDLERIDAGGVRPSLEELMAAAMGNADNRGRISLVQETIVPWSQRVNALRLAIVDAALDHATEVRNERVRRLWLVSMAITAVVTTVLVCLAVLHWRVVRPLAQLGLAIARIAAGDGSDPISLRSSTREINEMATAVETLRQAAQIAHATAMRRRQAADRRLRALRDVLGILRTVQEPARALERDLASLARGIDAALALATTSTKSPPATLSTAADSVRLGLEEMRNATADLDASIAAARVAQTRERPEDEIVAHILAAQTHASRRDEAVRGFILPSLVGLRDAATAGSEEPMLLELVRVQFQRIEAAVAMVASMRASVLQASTIVDELRQDEAPIAA